LIVWQILYLAAIALFALFTVLRSRYVFLVLSRMYSSNFIPLLNINFIKGRVRGE
jgi:hypothetical protein